MAAIVIVIVVDVMAEFCGGLWLRPLSQDLFSPRVLSNHYHLVKAHDYSLRSKKSGNGDRASEVLIGGFCVLEPIEQPCF